MRAGLGAYSAAACREAHCLHQSARNTLHRARRPHRVDCLYCMAPRHICGAITFVRYGNAPRYLVFSRYIQQRMNNSPRRSRTVRWPRRRQTIEWLL